MSKHYETIVGYTYEAQSPIDAAQQLIDNLKYAGLYISVRDMETNEKFLVDSEDWSIE